MDRPGKLARLSLLPVLFLVLAGGAAAQEDRLPLADHRTESWFLPGSPGVTAGPAAAFFNPAALALNDRSSLDFWWDDGDIRGGLDNYGLAFGRNLGFGLNTTTWGVPGDSYRTYDYQVTAAGGGRRGTFGLAYRWSHGDTDRLARQKAVSAGFVHRPGRAVSFGTAGTWSLESGAAQYVLDLGLRPLGRDWLTLFADWTANADEAFFRQGTWGAGLGVRPMDGLQLGLRVREHPGSDDVEYALSVGLAVRDLAATAFGHYDQDGDRVASGGFVRTHPAFAGLTHELPRIDRGPDVYYPLSLENRVLTYQKYRYFDDTRVAWLDLMLLLDRLRDSDDVKGVAVNLAGFRGRPSLLWEFRRKLQELQAVGKEIIVHTDRLSQTTYYLASVADRLTMDPQGGLALPGIVLSRSYLKGTLEKVGIGFQEHRYFEYKSAAETLSRDSMSEADREQRQRVVDVIYEELRRGSAAGRSLDEARYDQVVDDLGQLTPAEAVQAGLVDDTGRWDDLNRWLRENRRARLTAAGVLPPARELYDEDWGPAVHIPVVYAVGPCDMDEGIKGRATGRYLRALAKNPTVAAVVLRADSPGGDPLPSDLVADAVRQLREAGKPVIVSQGDVAASGGYWISMDGTEILTTPLTVTGSIGVISGWVWDDGAASKLGVTADAVSRGRHADLYSTVGIPLLGSLPRRPMNDEELDRAEKLIRGMYDDFVQAVAAGRGLDPDAVHEVAQGRVWMGEDAIEHRLCDRLGGLSDAIAAARTAAGVPQWRQVKLVEFPPRQLFAFPRLLPDLPGLAGLTHRLNGYLGRLLAGTEVVPAVPEPHLLPGLGALDSGHILRMGREPGQPLLALPPQLLPEQWKDWD